MTLTMKKTTILGVVLISLISFTSCNSDDQLELTQPEAILDEYSVARGEDGNYTLDYKINNGIADVNLEEGTNTTNIDLFTKPAEMSKTNSFVQDLFLHEYDKLNIKFNDVNENSSKIRVEDNDIKFSKGRIKGQDHLRFYQVKRRKNGDVRLFFKTKKNIEVKVDFNDELKEFEVHLIPSTDPAHKNSQMYNRTFKKQDGEDLIITFVNYFKKNNSGARTTEGSLDEWDTRRKPRIIIANGEEDKD